MRIAVTNPITGQVTYTESIDSVSSTSNSTNQVDGTSFADTLINSAKSLKDELSSSITYKDIFREASEKYGVPFNLLTAVAWQESNITAGITSNSGAMGIMQLMPQTAAYLGVNNAYDAYENIMGGAKLLAENLAKYNGNVDVALAAYNMGDGSVQAAGGVPSGAVGYVQRIKSLMNEGVTIPDVVYKAADNAKAQVAENLEKLLSEFSGHESYDRFVELMQVQAADQIDAAKHAKESGDEATAQKAYREMLSSASVVIKQMIEEKTKESETSEA